MSRAIIISIDACWAAKILNGDKTIEVRKTFPTCDLPIDVYIYVTKRHNLVLGDNYYGDWVTEYSTTRGYSKEQVDKIWGNLSGKIVAKFTLNKIEKFDRYDTIRTTKISSTCLSSEELLNYAGEKSVYFWHIDDLKIFDEPKELSDFFQAFKCRPCRGTGWRKHQVLYNYKLKCLQQTTNSGYEYAYPIKRAPQSWCYCEVI